MDAIKGYDLFTTLSFIIRGFEALGASAYSTASYVIIMNTFPDNAGTVRVSQKTVSLKIYVKQDISLYHVLRGSIFMLLSVL